MNAPIASLISELPPFAGGIASGETVCRCWLRINHMCVKIRHRDKPTKSQCDCSCWSTRITGVEETYSHRFALRGLEMNSILNQRLTLKGTFLA
jgi:hypothetical protein